MKEGVYMVVKYCITCYSAMLQTAKQTNAKAPSSRGVKGGGGGGGILRG